MSSEQDADLVIPKRPDCLYTACYCEENVWHLAKLILDSNKAVSDMKCYIVFVSNPKKCVHLWKQNNCHQEGLVFWDYHVFVVVQHRDKSLVFDLDTTLPFPVPFSQYSKEAIRNEFNDIHSKRYFKLVDAEKYLVTFSSDRGHMLEGEHWMSPPPSYPPILNEEKKNNLDSFIAMDSSELGEILDIEEFKARFS